MKPHSSVTRRTLFSRLGAGLAAATAAVAAGARQVRAQAPANTGFSPARHAEDAWMDAAGKHRVIFDVTSAAGVGDVFRFVSNTYTGNKNGYGLDPADLAVIVILRHSATAFGYADAVWAKHGPALVQATRYTVPAGGDAPRGNPFSSGSRGSFDDILKRGVRIGVCDTASHGLAGRLAGSGDADATYKDMVANMLPSSRLVPAGVVAIARAQEYGYSVIHVG